MSAKIRKLNFRRLAKLAAGLLLVLLLLSAFWPHPHSHPLANGRQAAVFNAATRGVALIITNNNDFNWTNTRITITQAKQSFSLQAGTITAGDTQGFLLSDFTTGGGEVLEHVDIKPAAVSVVTREAQGSVQVN